MSTPADERPGVVTPSSLREWALPQPEGSKHSRGSVLVLGGSPTTPGAAMLAGLAALRVGAGVLRLAVAASVAPAVAAAVPEASVTPVPQLDGGAWTDAVAAAVASADAVLVGPGIDAPGPAVELVRAVLEHRDEAAVVFDAFALGVLADALEGRSLGHRDVLTPNSSEAAHLLDRSSDRLSDEPDEDVARELAARFGVVATYSGVVADPGGQCWTVPGGHVGLGTSGSGDVLAGVVAGLLARGAEPAQAACWATYAHATAGDRLAARVGRLGFLARELVEELPFVLVQTEA